MRRVDVARRHLLLGHLALAGAAVVFSKPAAAGITVLGAGNARMCFLAAQSKLSPRPADMKRCNDALVEERTSADRLVATHVNRGILRLRRNDAVGALADFDAASKLDPEEPEAYLNRASALLSQQQAAAAIGQFDTALAKKTRRPALAYYGRAVAYEEAGNLRAAYQDYSQASRLAPSWDEPRRELTRFRIVSR
jgi:tetratricopeptide (TPR) repeat protein